MQEIKKETPVELNAPEAMSKLNKRGILLAYLGITLAFNGLLGEMILNPRESAGFLIHILIAIVVCIVALRIIKKSGNQRAWIAWTCLSCTCIGLLVWCVLSISDQVMPFYIQIRRSKDYFSGLIAFDTRLILRFFVFEVFPLLCMVVAINNGILKRRR